MKLLEYLTNESARSLTLVNSVTLLVILAWMYALFAGSAEAADALEPFAYAALGSILGTSLPKKDS
ncbi:MAG: hypothetical protein ACYS0F_20135 [Planctomycetota bacterium]|jgi:hypothetical protein